jgi:biopolymer transport protein ExbD
MADIDTSGGGKKKGGKKRSKKMSTKIDMTPMVDLAFLLITFFMLTTTFNKPQTMEINMPDKTEKKDEENMKVAASRTLTVLLAKDDAVYWYQGDNDPASVKVQKTDFNDQAGIRKVIMDKSAEIMKASGKDAVIIIKALDNAKYKNLVDMLDEMHITNQKIYAIVDVYDVDKEMLLAQHPGSI